MSALPLAASRRASRRLLAACTASLLVLPLLVGCGHRNRQCTDSTPVNERFWEISDQRRQLIAETRSVEPRANGVAGTTVARTDEAPSTESAATTVDPFMTAEESAEPVKQVAARESKDSERDQRTLSDFDEFDREMESLRREAGPATRESKPSLEWADDVTTPSDVARGSMFEESAPSLSAAGTNGATERSQFEEEFDPAEFADDGSVADVEEPAATTVAEELLDGPLDSGEAEAHPLVGNPLAGSPPVVRDVFDGPPVVQPKRPMTRESVRAVDASMIVDTIEIRPRGYRDTPTLEDRVAMIESRATPLKSETVPVANETKDEGLWSKDATVEAVEGPSPEPTEIAMALPVEPSSTAAPSLTAPGIAEPSRPPFAPPREPMPEPTNEVPAPRTEVLEESPVAIDQQADTFTGSPLLVAPSYTEEADETDVEIAAVTGPMLETPLPALIGPARADEAEETDVVDPFLTNGKATTVATLRSLDFEETETELDLDGTGSGTSSAWWFGGLAVGGVLLLLRARKRFLA